jgi:hypothetical protein
MSETSHWQITAVHGRYPAESGVPLEKRLLPFLRLQGQTKEGTEFAAVHVTIDGDLTADKAAVALEALAAQIRRKRHELTKETKI